MPFKKVRVAIAITVGLCVSAAVVPGFLAATPPKGDIEFVARVTDEGEPGVPLHVRGTVRHRDDGRPVAGALLYVYQTDAAGYYTPKTNDNSNPRLKAWVRTDPQGRFELLTIRPGSYPDSRVQQHIHYELHADGVARLRGEIVFADDPNLRESTREAPPRGWVVVEPRKTTDGGFECEAVLNVPG